MDSGVAARADGVLHDAARPVHPDGVHLPDPVQADEWARFHKLKSDPRITGIGHWLRKYSKGDAR